MSSNLIQALSTGLQDALTRATASGENVIVALPGAMGEALIATDKRIIIVRETDPYHAPATYIYPLSALRDINIGTSPTGGIFGVAADYPIPGDEGTVYFPSERMEDFQAAAHAIRRLMATNGQNQPAAAGVKGSVAVEAAACPTCGASIGPRDSFCAVCGTQLRDVCQICGGAMPSTAAFCPGCGSEAHPATVTCASCGARANSQTMTYCPQCGTSLTKKCMSCGGSVVPGWPRCRYCGREIGSVQDASYLATRVANRQQQAPSPQSSESSSQVASAAEHNARGAQLFEQDRAEEAIVEFRMATELDPENSSYHCNLAVVYDDVEQDDEARKEYERALEINPQDRTALLYLGYIMNESNEPERAAELWAKLTQIAPGTPEAEEAAQNMRAQGQL